jgi:hypothetical protein
MNKVPKKFILSAIVFILSAPVLAFSGQVTVGSVVAHPGDHFALPVYLEGNDIDIMALAVPLKYSSPDISVDSVSFAGTLIKPNMSGVAQINNGEQWVKIAYLPIIDLVMISEPSGLLANIYFTVNPAAPDHVVDVDSINHLEWAGPPELWTRLEIADTSGYNYYLPDFSAGQVEIQMSTGVDDDKLGLPKVLALKQNYPNPFNPSTTVGFSLPERSYVSLKVFNILGQETATLVDRVMEPGDYEVVWDAKNEASGIYFYRLGYKNQVLTKKMTYLK